MSQQDINRWQGQPLSAVFAAHRARLLGAVVLFSVTMVAGTALLGLSGGFLTASALAGLAGSLQVAISASAMPNMAQGGEMDVIAACVIGGVSMSGGRGSVVGVLFGAIIMAMIPKALPLLHIDALWQNMIKGVMILAVVLINVVLQRIATRNALNRREM